MKRPNSGDVARLHLSESDEWRIVSAKWGGPEDARPLLVAGVLDAVVTTIPPERRFALLATMLSVINETERVNSQPDAEMNLDDFVYIQTEKLLMPLFMRHEWRDTPNPDASVLIEMGGAFPGQVGLIFTPTSSATTERRLALAMTVWDWFSTSRSTTTNQLVLGGLLCCLAATIHGQRLQAGEELRPQDQGLVIDQAMGLMDANLGHADLRGADLKRTDDESGARTWYEQAATLDHSDAMNNLGVLAKKAGDLDAARVWAEKAATLGNPDAMNNLGALAEDAGDKAEARGWYEKAAKLGNPDAMNNLGLLAYAAGDLDAARAWYEKATKLDDPGATFNLGLLAEKAGDLEGARAWYEKAAKLDDPGAMNNLGLRAERAGDEDAARAWWEQAAKLDHPEAMNNLGFLAYEAGDMKGARAWWEQAAKLDHPKAMFSLGVLAGNAGDLEGARVWLEKAAKLGNPDAARALAMLDAVNN